MSTLLSKLEIRMHSLKSYDSKSIECIYCDDPLLVHAFIFSNIVGGC